VFECDEAILHDAASSQTFFGRYAAYLCTIGHTHQSHTNENDGMLVSPGGIWVNGERFVLLHDCVCMNLLNIFIFR
jgi:hypothetical protein